MNPKKHKDFHKGIAEQVGVHPDVVDEFIAFYYGKVRKNLSDLTYPSLFITGLGTFHLRKLKLDKSIKRYKSILGNLEKQKFDGYEKHVGVREKLEGLEKAMVLVESVQLEKKEFKTKKDETKKTS